MKFGPKKFTSILLLVIFILSQTVSVQAAKNCCTPPPGYDQPACVIPGQTEKCCPKPNCCQPKCSPCDPCNTCNDCDCCDSCSCSGNDAVKIEHLCTNKDTPVDLVKICGCNATISQNSVLEVTLAQKVFSKRLHCGDNIAFNLCHGLYTKEGRKILPSGTKIIASIDCIVPPKALNKNAKVGLKFKCIMLPCGTTYPICARIFNKEGMLKETKWMSAGRVTAWTIGGLGIGAGLAAACGAGSPDLSRGIFSIGMPVGFGIGLLASLLGPGLHYRGKCGEKVLIQLTDCLQISMN